MGAFGTGPFENDTALDFLSEIGDAAPAERPDLVLSALDRVLLAEGFVDADDMCEAIAAAAAVSASISPGIAGDEPYLPDWLEERPLDTDEELVEKSRTVLRRALRAEDGEWWLLWEEAGETGAVRAALKRSFDRLGDRDD